MQIKRIQDSTWNRVGTQYIKVAVIVPGVAVIDSIWPQVILTRASERL